MIRVTIEVSDGTSRRLVTVCAQSIQQAVDLVSGNYAGNIRIVLPLDSETFFMKEAAKVKLEEFVILEETTDGCVAGVDGSKRGVGAHLVHEHQTPGIEAAHLHAP